MTDILNIEIMEDGVIKITTDAISPVNHVSADELLTLIETLTGGKHVTEKRKTHNAHVYKHVHTHERA